MFKLTTTPAAPAICSSWAKLELAMDNLERARCYSCAGDDLARLAKKIAAAQDARETIGMLVRTLTGMICLWRTLQGKEVRSAIAGAFLRSCEGPLADQVRALLDSVAAGGITYLRT